MTHDQMTRPSGAQGLQRRLALTTALVSASVFGYGGRAAHAGSCAGGAGTYTCSGAASGTDVTQVLSGTPLTVTTSPGFGITASSYFGFLLSSTGGGLTFTDAHASTITTGGRNGIDALNLGSGALSVTVTGTVSGGTGVGIATQTGAGGETTIVLNDGASVSATSGNAITNDAGNSTVTVNAGASVTGAIRLGGGSDSLAFDGGDFSGVTAFDGGDGAGDALSFGAGAAGVLDGDRVTGFETVLFGDGSAVSVFDTLTADVAVMAGGMLVPGASPGKLSVVGAFDVAAGGTLGFELGGLLPGTEYDVIDVTGTASLADGMIFEISSFGGFVPVSGNMFDILIADEISLSALSNLIFDFDIGGSWSTDIVDVGGRDALRLTSVAPVPVPPALALFGSGLASLLGLGWARRRTQRLAA